MKNIEMKIVWLILIMLLQTYAISGKIYKSKDDFTNEEIVWFTNKNNKDGRLFVSASGKAGYVKISYSAPPGNVVDCRNNSILIKDKDEKIHKVDASDSRTWCSATVRQEILNEKFMMRVPLYRGYADLTIDAKEYDPLILTK